MPNFEMNHSSTAEDGRNSFLFFLLVSAYFLFLIAVNVSGPTWLFSFLPVSANVKWSLFLTSSLTSYFFQARDMSNFADDWMVIASSVTLRIMRFFYSLTDFFMLSSASVAGFLLFCTTQISYQLQPVLSLLCPPVSSLIRTSQCTGSRLIPATFYKIKWVSSSARFFLPPICSFLCCHRKQQRVKNSDRRRCWNTEKRCLI